MDTTPQEQEVLLLDDYPEHLDPPVDSLETIPPSEPESLQTNDDMMKAHRRLRAVIRPPQRYGFDDEAKTETRARIRVKNLNKTSKGSSELPTQRPRRNAKIPSRYLDFCLNYNLFTTPFCFS